MSVCQFQHPPDAARRGYHARLPAQTRSMLISESHRFLFVKVHKTAGTSITEALRPLALAPSASRFNKLASDLGLGRDWRQRYFRPHAPLRHAERVLPAPTFRALYKFAFVRNPWDRLVSWYSFILQDPGHRRHRRVGRLPSFEAFVRRELANPRRSQWRMLTLSDGRLGLDFVGRFESLERDMAIVCRELGIDCLPLPRTKVSSHRPYQEYYSPALAQLVAESCRREIDEFGYRFDG